MLWNFALIFVSEESDRCMTSYKRISSTLVPSVFFPVLRLRIFAFVAHHRIFSACVVAKA